MSKVFVHKKINKIYKMYVVVRFILTVRRGYIFVRQCIEAAQCLGVSGFKWRGGGGEKQDNSWEKENCFKLK